MPVLPGFLRHAPLALSLAILPLAGAAAETVTAAAELTGANGEAAGRVTFSEWPSGVLIEVSLTGLEPGEHGIHIHEKGDCGNAFAAAGGHFNPSGHGHGFSSAEGAHAGDLPNIFVNADGAATAHFLNDQISLSAGPASIFDADGAAMIVHEKPDSYGADAGAGGRAACGVIRLEP